VFVHDTARLSEPLGDMNALLEWAKANPGRFTFPQPPDFLGTTFLKQALIDLSDDTSVLQSPATEENYAAATAPLWAFLEELTPNLWREGRAYPQTGPRQLQLISDGEVDLAISFSPGEASAAIANFQLPETARTFVLDNGTLGNASFVAIPYNSGSAAGAMVLANFLMSPEAQARQQDPNILGYGTVLNMDALDADQRAAFDALELGVATLSPADLGSVQAEPHPSWSERIAAEWIDRYGVAE
jgi:putative thiamine transport system substrate-binding protein